MLEHIYQCLYIEYESRIACDDEETENFVANNLQYTNLYLAALHNENVLSNRHSVVRANHYLEWKRDRDYFVHFRSVSLK